MAILGSTVQDAGPEGGDIRGCYVSKTVKQPLLAGTTVAIRSNKMCGGWTAPFADSNPLRTSMIKPISRTF